MSLKVKYRVTATVRSEDAQDVMNIVEQYGEVVSDMPPERVTVVGEVEYDDVTSISDLVDELTRNVQSCDMGDVALEIIAIDGVAVMKACETAKPKGKHVKQS